jgi:protein disulfide-isomerase A1
MHPDSPPTPTPTFALDPLVPANGYSDVIDLTIENFEATIASEHVMLVLFYIPWHSPCKALAPYYEEAATILKEKYIKLARVAFHAEADLCKRYDIQCYP